MNESKRGVIEATLLKMSDEIAKYVDNGYTIEIYPAKDGVKVTRYKSEVLKPDGKHIAR